MNQSNKMPAIFVGHGSPMNAIENNEFTRGWVDIAKTILKPRAILSVSAHWVTEKLSINNQQHPEMVYDMYGFPNALYDVIYHPLGAPAVAADTLSLLGPPATYDNRWGIDHGTWSVLKYMYPQADVPTFQLSIDANGTMTQHFEIGRKLQSLREQGVLLLGTGNVVHNLALIQWDNPGGEPWAEEFDRYVKQSILSHNYQSVVDYKEAGSCATKAFYSTEHFVPLVVLLGAVEEEEPVQVYNEACVMGSLSMTSYVFG